MITIPIDSILSDPDRFKPIYIVAKGLLLGENRPSDHEFLAYDILDKLPKKATDLLLPGVTIAGGALRSCIDGTPMKDVDIYFDNISVFLDVLRNKLGWKETFHIESYRDTNIMKCRHWLGDSVSQADLIVYPHCTSVQDLFDSFDFECCKWAIDYQNIYINSERTISDTKNKICTVSRPISLYRKIQYESKGYKFLTPPVLKERPTIGTDLAF